MKRLLEISEYIEDVERIAALECPWEKLLAPLHELNVHFRGVEERI